MVITRLSSCNVAPSDTVLIPGDKPPRDHFLTRSSTDGPIFTALTMTARSAFRSRTSIAHWRVTRARNAMIFDDVLTALEAGRSPVVLTERKDHLTLLAERLARFAKNVIVLRGGMNNSERRQVMEAMATVPEWEERVLLATGRYLGEGFDDPRLDTLFLTMPISWRGTLAQYAGRLHRLHPTKRQVVIFDYVDGREPVFAKMSAKRDAGYASLGYETADREDALTGISPRKI